MKVGFVNIFGKPNAGKSTLVNALMGEKMAIVSHKVQTTRHRIKAILSHADYQIIFSDTPGLITPKYKLHEKMMKAVNDAKVDADIGLLLMDINEDWEETAQLFHSLKLKAKCLLGINKIDKVKPERVKEAIAFFKEQNLAEQIFPISAAKNKGLQELLAQIITNLPEGEPFYDEDDMSDLPVKFFVSELVREKIFELANAEIPYHTTVLVREYKEKTTLVKIVADIIVHRETQKMILIGENGSMIKKIGSGARKNIEEYLGRKVFLELFVKVKPKWRENEHYLKEYGY